MKEFALRYGLLIYFALFFFLAFLARSILVYRRSGKNPLVFSGSDDAHGYVGRAFKLVILGCAAIVSFLAFSPDITRWMRASGWELPEPLFYSGWGLLLISLVVALIAQAQMGLSWRVGIDSKNRTELVEHGLFGISRNPIFLSMRFELLGLFLVFPTAPTLVLLFCGEILMQVQVRLEEQHLAALHGQKYLDYRGRVRRWL